MRRSGGGRRGREVAGGHRAPSPPKARSNRILIAVVLFYVAVLGAMVAFDQYLFFVKSLILPVLILAALVSGRLRSFINDWAVFLAVVVFFEFGRGLTFALTTHFELPMHLNYVIRAERWLCGGAIAPLVLQHLRAGLADPYWFDRFFVLVYSSHFLFFLLFGFGLWYTRRPLFRPYAIAIAGVLYGGLIIYFAVPTIPPWAASSEFLVLPPITQIVRAFYKVHVPQLVTVFDTNPIAAMPSLHAALPAVCALFALRYLGRWGLLVLAYALAVWIAVVYLGEHYMIDIVAGIVLAGVVFAAGQWWAARRAATAPSMVPGASEGWDVGAIATALVLIAGAVGFGQLSAYWVAPVPITRRFIQRELIGRSILAHYYLGRLAFDQGRYAEARAELTLAMNEMTKPSDQKVVRAYLGQSAAHLGDAASAIAVLEPIRATADAKTLSVLGSAYVDTNQYDTGMAVLQEARTRFPAEPEPFYWLTRYQYQRGTVDRAYVQSAIEILARAPSAKNDAFRRRLAEVLEGK